MLKYILKRLGLLTITLVIIIVAVFFLLQLMPGYPKAIQTQIDQAKTQQEVKAILASFQPKSNVFERFGDYISGIFHGDFGKYYTSPSTSIATLFLKPMKYTLVITGPAFLIGTLFGLVFGFIAGYKRGKWQDISLNLFATFFIAVPSFVLATFVLAFGRKVGLPVDWQNAQLLGKTFTILLLPIFIITITSFATLTYFIRNEVVEVLTSDYINIARAKGVSETGIFFKHVVRNVSIPIVAITLPSFIGIVMGSLIIEVFFGIPGSSHIFANAIQEKETYVVMFSTVFFTALGLLISIVTDVIFVLLDPRIKLAEASKRPLILTIKAYFNRQKQLKELKTQEVTNG